MPSDPVEEWRRLTALYSEMGDIEIQDLAEQIDDLTPAAQQVLRDEIKKRGAGPQSSGHGVPSEASVDDLKPEERSDPSVYPPNGGGPIDYSWKVPLCQCESYAAAQQLGEMLRRAKIDAWVDRPSSSSYVRWEDLGAGELQILVAADQLEQAKLIAAQPVPQDIVDEVQEVLAEPEYELPTCPHCGAHDPVLESVEPSNNWLCESCDHTWSDPVPEDSKEQGTASGA